MSSEGAIVIVGAGPAGVRAAEALIDNGLHPVLIDEAPDWGGQIYRQQPSTFQRPLRDLYGFEAKRAHAIHSCLAPKQDRFEFRRNTLVWNIEPSSLSLSGPNGNETLAFSQLILATGATDKVLPLPGWTLPGVFTLGGSQVALKYQGCAIGQRVVFAGTGPLLYLVAYQYAKAGADVVAVLDTSPALARIKALPYMTAAPATLAKGMYYIADLMRRGIRLVSGCSLVRIEGTQHTSGITWRRGNKQGRIDCDAVGLGYGLRSEQQLAELAGCAFEKSPTSDDWDLVTDIDGRTSVPGIYTAGDGAAILGAQAAEASGQLAALAVISDRGRTTANENRASLRNQLQRAKRFQSGLRIAFPIPHNWASQIPEETVICRCERITAEMIRKSATEFDTSEINRAKSFSRAGMGRCQGRMCGVGTRYLLRDQATEPGRFRSQAPIKPIPLGLFDEVHRDDG